MAATITESSVLFVSLFMAIHPRSEPLNMLPAFNVVQSTLSFVSNLEATVTDCLNPPLEVTPLKECLFL